MGHHGPALILPGQLVRKHAAHQHTGNRRGLHRLMWNSVNRNDGSNVRKIIATKLARAKTAIGTAPIGLSKGPRMLPSLRYRCSCGFL